MSKSKATLNLLDSLRLKPAVNSQRLMTEWYRVPDGGLARLETHVDRCEGGSLVLSLEGTRNREEVVELLRIEHHDACIAVHGDAEPSAHCGRSGRPCAVGDEAPRAARLDLGPRARIARPVGNPLLCYDWLTLDPGSEVRASLAVQSPGTEVRLAVSRLCITWE